MGSFWSTPTSEADYFKRRYAEDLQQMRERIYNYQFKNEYTLPLILSADHFAHVYDTASDKYVLYAARQAEAFFKKWQDRTFGTNSIIPYEFHWIKSADELFA